jgi:outer membrane protein insertion porin family/translocation and assembly module TamA
LPENSLGVRLEQPAFLEGRTQGYVETGFNVYPLLYPLAPGTDPTKATVLGYAEIPSSVGLSRSFFGRRLPITLSYNYRFNVPFVYQPQNEKPAVDPIVVTYPELSIALDARNDPLQPTQGIFISMGIQKALPTLGSDVSDIRLRPEARFFWPLDNSRKIVFAARTTLGFLFPETYGGSLGSLTPDANDQHKLLFRGFYSGGPDSNRGYPYQRIGPQGPIAFLTPEADCAAAVLPDVCTLPLGGLSLWEASVELRYRFLGPWAVVLFADTSDVNIGRGSLTFTKPHLSVGPGLRYASPVGPIRVDLGYRVHGAQSLGPDAPGEPPDVTDVAPYNEDSKNVPLALSILIGEAF